MKHLSKKELILFSYKDLPCKKLNFIEKHLQACSRCRKEAEQIKEMLVDFKFNQPNLAPNELDLILAEVRAEANQSQKESILVSVGNYFSNLLKGLTMFFFKPKVAVVLVSIFLVVFAIHLYNNEADKFSLQVSEIEFDLVTDDEFDIFLDSYQFQNQSYISSSKIISS